MTTQHRPWDDYMQEVLSDRTQALAYLNAAIEEYEADENAEAFLLALRRVADAQGGLTHLADETGLNRQHLYDALSKRGNPRLDTLSRIFKGLGYRLRVDLAATTAP
jgi:probable addiction module antidote protein